MNIVLSRQFFIFLIVGMVNSVFGYSVYAVSLFAGFHYSIAMLFSTCLGVLFNFKSTGKIVFKSSDNRLLLKFIGVYAFLYLLNLGLMQGLQCVSSNLYLTFFLTLVPMAMIGFVLNKCFVFKDFHEIN